MRFNVSISIRALLVCAAVLASANRTDAQISTSYRLVELGNLGQRSFAYRVNERGEAVGVFYRNASDPSDLHGFVYRGGRMVDLFPSHRSLAADINEAGAIAGWGLANTPYKGWVHSNGPLQTIPALADDQSYAVGINNAGTVVGYMPTGGPSTHPFMFQNGRTIDLGVAPGAFGGWAIDINDAGTIVGIATGGTNYPVMYKDGAWTSLAPEFQHGGWVFGINEAGEVAGRVNVIANNDFIHRAFRYRDGQLTLIGDPVANSTPGDINNHGVLVGSYGPENNRRAFVEHAGRFVDLNTLVEPGSGWVLRHAEGISDAGHIVGYGRSRNGSERAFMLVPVPEPGFVGVAVVGGVLMLGRGRRRVVVVAAERRAARARGWGRARPRRRRGAPGQN